MRQAGEYIRQLRREYGWTQQQLAAAVGVDVRSVGRWERGENRPPADHLARMMALLRGSLDHVSGLLSDDPVETDAQVYELTDEERRLIEALSPLQRQALIQVAQAMLRNERSL